MTDIVKYKSDDPTAVIQNWMRNRDVIEFLGLWESLHNSEVHGTRNKYHLVEQDNYILVDGQHNAIIEEDVWHAAQVKMLAQVKNTNM